MRVARIWMLLLCCLVNADLWASTMEVLTKSNERGMIVYPSGRTWWDVDWHYLPEVELMSRRQAKCLDGIRYLRQLSLHHQYEWTRYLTEKNPSFYLKYQRPDFGEIKYQPRYLSQVLPQTGDERFSVLKSGSASFRRSVIDELNDSLFVYHPQLVEYNWNKIPSPHRVVMDGGLMDKKAAQNDVRASYLESPRKVIKPREEIKTWVYTGTEALQMTEAYFDNWVKGGENSISLLSDLRVSANYKRNKMEWDNKLLHKLGIISQQDQRMRINDDVIQLTSKLGMNASKKWYYSVMYDFKTQFFYGRDKNDYEKILSGFMSPGYQTFAIGMDYKRSKDFTILISPLTSKITFVMDTVHIDPSRYNIPDGQKSDAQTGASVTSAITTKLMPELTLTSNLDYFYSYLDDEGKSQFEWEIILNMRINKYLSTRLIPHVRYYQNESENFQFKQNLTIAFNYTF